MVGPSSQKPLHPRILEIFKMFPERRKNLLSFVKHLGLEWQAGGWGGGSHLIPSIDVSASREIAFSPLLGLK